MENIKVKVRNKVESKEVQELFFELGCHWYYNGKQNIENVIGFINSHEDMSLTSGSILNSKHKKLTIPQLRDLVVLKRNDVGDATHTTTDDVWKFYIGHDTYCYERKNGVIGWHKEDSKCYGLKPIEEKK